MWKQIKQALADYFDRKHDGFKQKMIRSSMARRTQFLNHHLYVNNEETKLKIQRLRTDQEICDQLATLQELDYDHCYLICRLNRFNTIGFQIRFDLVVVDLKWEVTEIYESVNINEKGWEFKKPGHLFVMAVNTVQFLNLQVGDCVCPMYQVA